MQPFLISVIVTTYNRPDALLAVLRGLLAQTDSIFEILIADDGSTDETRRAIANFVNVSKVDIRHLWQEDIGFRAAAARNKGILSARGDYLIFLDGDCVPQCDFVARHRSLARSGGLVTGARILVSETFTAAVLRDDIRLGEMSVFNFLKKRITGSINKWLPFVLKLPGGPWRNREGFIWRRIKSCNLAVWKADALAVNGFDESFTGWGHEDADFVLRLFHAGIMRTDGAYATEVLHLWHREAIKDHAESNYETVRGRMSTRQVRASSGIDEVLERGEKWRID